MHSNIMSAPLLRRKSNMAPSEQSMQILLFVTIVAAYLMSCYLRIHSSYEKCDPNDPNNWWNMPPVDAVPYATGVAENSASKDTAMATGAADGGGSIREDSFGTNNQVTIVGIKIC